MKAAELLRLYEAGKRDFRGENLRGQNFKGKALSGADFSEADIRSANFANANLIGANFTNAKAGLQRRWVVALLIGASLLAVVAGFLSGVAGSFVALRLFDSDSIQSEIILWTTLVSLTLFEFFIVRQGIKTGALVFAGALALAGAGGFALGSSGAGVLALGGTFNVAGSIAFSITRAVAGARAFFFNVAISLVVAGYWAVGVSMNVRDEYSVFGTAIAVSVVLTLMSTYIAWRALSGDARDAWIRSGAVAFAAIGGTSFRGATLTDTDFSQAILKSTDFRHSVLLRTRWRDAEKLDRVRPGETYLNNPKIRELVLTGDGQGQSYDYLLNLTLDSPVFAETPGKCLSQA